MLTIILLISRDCIVDLRLSKMLCQFKYQINKITDFSFINFNLVLSSNFRSINYLGEECRLAIVLEAVDTGKTVGS